MSELLSSHEIMKYCDILLPILLNGDWLEFTNWTLENKQVASKVFYRFRYAGLSVLLILIIRKAPANLLKFVLYYSPDLVNITTKPQYNCAVSLTLYSNDWLYKVGSVKHSFNWEKAEEQIKVLLEFGADKYYINEKGQSPLDLAILNNAPQHIFDLLKKN
jgi:hypothetical protein